MSSRASAPFSAFYDDYWRREPPPPLTDPTFDERWRKLRRALRGVPERAKVLDYGCGNGLFSAALVKAGYAVTGVDISEQALQLARANVKGVDFYSATDVDSWFTCEGYDACWCSEVLEHLFSPSEALSKIACALRPQGLFVGTVPYHGLLKNLAISLLAFEHHFNVEGPHIRFFTKLSLFRTLRANGFQPVRWSGVGRVWPFWRSVFFEAKKDHHEKARVHRRALQK